MQLFSIFLKLMCLNNNKIYSKNSSDRYINFLNANNIYHSKKSNNTSTINTGVDERPYLEYDENIELININVNFHKKRILDSLINDNLATLEKIDILNKNFILPDTFIVNITSGGLLYDFNFEIF